MYFDYFPFKRNKTKSIKLYTWCVKMISKISAMNFSFLLN